MKKNIVKRFFKEGVIYSLGPVLEKLIGIFLIPVYTAYLTPEDFGNLQYILTIGAFLLPFIRSGLTTSFWKFRNKSAEASPGEVCLNVVVTQLFLGLTTVVVVTLFKLTFYQDPIANLIIIYVLALAVSTVYKTAMLVLQASHRVKSYLFISVLYAAVLAASNILFVAYFEMGYGGVIISNLVVNVMFSVIFSFILFSDFDGRINIRLSREMTRYGFPLAMGNIGYVVMNLSDVLFLKAYSLETELGLYTFGYKFAALVNIFVLVPFFRAWNPIRWEIYHRGDGKELFASFAEGLLLVLPFLTLVVTAVSVCIGTLLTSNKEFLEGFQVIVLIGASFAFYALSRFYAMGLLFEEKTKIIMRIVLSSAALNLILNLILIPPYGMVGAAIATLTSFVVMACLSMYTSQKHYPIKRNRIAEWCQLSLLIVVAFLSVWVFNLVRGEIITFVLFIFTAAALLLILGYIVLPDVAKNAKELLGIYKFRKIKGNS